MNRLTAILITAVMLLGGCSTQGRPLPQPAPPGAQTSQEGTSVPTATQTDDPTKRPSQQSSDSASVQEQKPEEMARCEGKNVSEFSVAGIKLRSPGAPVLARLGKPTKVETFPRYGDSLYHFSFGTVHALGDGQITGITFWADPPIGELWTGIRIGTPKQTVLAYLEKRGFCGIPQPNETDVTFPHASDPQLLVLSFTAEGLLHAVSLVELGE